MASVWQQQVVSDSSVYQAIAQLRKALGDTAAEPTYIQRVSGKGYRLIAQVKAPPTLTNQTKTGTDTRGTVTQEVSQLSPSEPGKNRLANWRFWLFAMFVSMFIAIIISVLSFSKPWQAPE
jgi:DNA-binding winged helix-turn-helix (wHTH) protein